MRKLMMGLVLAGLFVGVSTVLAEDGAGAVKGCKAGVCEKKGCSACQMKLEKLNLTDEQKTKVAALQKECKDAGCTKESKMKCRQGIEELLTPEQKAQWKEKRHGKGKHGQAPAQEKPAEKTN